MLNLFDLNKKVGISGCNLSIFEGDKIKKSSSSTKYNLRLQNQTTKQIKFESYNIENIKTPHVLSTGFTDGYFFFDMEYIMAELPFDFFLWSDIEKINNFSLSIQNYLEFIKKNSTVVEIKFFKISTINKLEELKKTSVYTDFIDFIINEINDLKTKTYQKSFCHGDLTLSNMLCQNNNLYFIDFLDSFIDTPIIDLVKLKQDLIYYWTVLISKKYNKNEIFKISQVCNFIWEKIVSQNEDLIFCDLFYILESINFLRIEPYSNTDDLKDTLNLTIKKTKLYEKFINTNGWKIK
jgi:thiamine kinase-like enzyme